MNNAATKNVSSRASLPILVLLGFLFAAAAAGQNATWPQLFAPYCGAGGCNDYQPQCPSTPQYISMTADSITVSAANTNGQVCLTANSIQKCVFLVGDAGVTEVSFDFSISSQCYLPSSSIAWLAFWMRSKPYSQNAEVDFVESKHGPAVNGLNMNFDDEGCQAAIYCGTSTHRSPPCSILTCTPSSGDWTGSVTATFSGPANQVAVAVTNSVNGNKATTTLTGGPTALSPEIGYYLLMDIDPQDPKRVISPQCQMTVSNLRLTGTVPSTVGGAPNCVGLPVISGGLEKSTEARGKT